MPKLNDYIGSLVSSITNARVMSDIQTVKVAEQYAQHDLLKHFSIPRLRIDDIEMTIPIALEEITHKKDNLYQPINNAKFNSIVYKQVVSSLGLKALSSSASRVTRNEIAKQTQTLENNIKTFRDTAYLKRYIEDIKQILTILERDKLISIEKINRKKINDNLTANLEKILNKEINVSDQKNNIEDLNVIVEANKLREQKPENIIYIKLKISEDGMEWNRAENQDGKIESKLLPE